jgi:hypothetical protein
MVVEVSAVVYPGPEGLRQRKDQVEPSYPGASVRIPAPGPIKPGGAGSPDLEIPGRIRERRERFSVADTTPPPSTDDRHWRLGPSVRSYSVQLPAIVRSLAVVTIGSGPEGQHRSLSGPTG